MGVKSKDRVERKQSFSFNIGSNPVLTAKIKDSEAVIDDGVKMMKKGLE